jgi:hypothetical protein
LIVGQRKKERTNLFTFSSSILFQPTKDVLTLQMIRIMDKLWIEAGHDLALKPYQVGRFSTKSNQSPNANFLLL